MAKKRNQETLTSLWEKAKKYYDVHDFESAMPFLDKILSLPAKSKADIIAHMKATNSKGIIYNSKTDFITAEKYFLRSLEYAQKVGNLVYIFNRFDNLGSCAMGIGNKAKAIEYFELSRKLKEQSGNEKSLLHTITQLTNLYTESGDIVMAEKNLTEILLHIKTFNKQDHYHYYYLSKANILQYKKDYEGAIKALNQSINYASRIHDYTSAAKLNADKGICYQAMQKWDKAKRSCEESLKIARKYKLRGIDIRTSTQLGEIAVAQGNLQLARSYYEYVNETILPEDIDFLHTDLAELNFKLHEAEGDLQNALNGYKTYLSYYKKQYDSENIRSVQYLQAKYEAEKKDRALEKAKLLNAQSELKALRAQMDPHFIFNALNSMRRELLEGNIDGADAYLVRFSKLLRLILDTTRTPEIRLSDNIELLHLYIQIEQTRQGNRFDYKIETRGIDPDTVFIPGMILQPLAENAIVHGLYHKKNGQGKLQISFSKSKTALVIKVKDNGVGRLASKDKTKSGHISHAMSIIRETLDLTWKGRNVKNYFAVKDLMTKDNINIGTEVTVLLPLP